MIRFFFNSPSPHDPYILFFSFPPGYLSLWQVNLTAKMGTFNVAAEVEGVKVEGERQMHLFLSGSQLDNLNRQLQFVTYTNTLYHPNTADIGGYGAILATANISSEANHGRGTVNITVRKESKLKRKLLEVGRETNTMRQASFSDVSALRYIHCQSFTGGAPTLIYINMGLLW